MLFNFIYRFIGSWYKNAEVRMLDFSTDPRFGIGDYYDGNHLCHRGAEKFTKILADTLHL